MPIDTTSTSGAPYFDDWSVSGNSAKNYLKILFQPGRSVQARELNQIQSGIQAQIDKFGSHIFKEGSPVIEGDINIDNKVQYIDLTLTANAVSAASDASRPLVGKEIYANSNAQTPNDSPTASLHTDVKAVIVDYENISDNEYRIYLRYTSSTTTFDNGSRAESAIKISEAVGSYLSANEALSGSTAAVNASYAVKISNAKGIYFVKGYFVEALAQSKYITFSSKQTSSVENVDGKVGFLVVENNRTAVNDSTLYDNATGAPNYSAPGADRYTITLDLAFITSNSDIDSTPAHVVAPSTANVIDVIQLTQSKVYEPVTVKYNQLGENFARRTFEESGDYTLQPFQLDLREHLKVGGNRGKFTGANGGQSSKFIAALEPSIAYVKGKRVDIQSKQEIVVDKGRDTVLTQNDVSFQAKFGTYVIADDITFLPDTDLSGTPTDYTFKTGADGSGTTVATCNIRGVEFTGRKYKIYLSNLTMTAGQKLRSARSLSGDADTTASETFIAKKNTGSAGFVLNDTNISNDIFTLPGEYVKSLSVGTAEEIKINIPVRLTLKQQGTTALSGGEQTVQIGSGSDVFYSDNPTDYVIVDETTGTDYICTDVVLSGTVTTTATLTFANSGSAVSNVDVIASVRREGTTRTKTKQQPYDSSPLSVSINVDAVGRSANLGSNGEDIIDIYEVKIGTDDVTKYFTLDNGQTPGAYGQPKIILSELIPNKSGSQTLLVKYNRFSHGSGDFFSVNSYYPSNTDDQGISNTSQVARQEVAAPTGISLLDTLDFRGGATLDPNGIIEIGSMTTFLPRHDRICIRSNGKLEYVEGDAVGGEAAEIPDDGMLLYDLGLPPFVSSVADIEIGYIDNSRYTMRDIGRIERRVKNLEYYSSLSLLEQATKDKQIFDDLGERFKNGILVDEFKGYGVANTANPAYAAALEPEKGILRPTFKGRTFSCYLADNTASDATGTTPAMGAHDHVRLKASGFEDFIHQPFASTAISVNPFDVASWVGELELSPKSDEWRDTTRRPDVIVKQDHITEAQLNILNEELAAQGVRWNDWSTTWVGEPEHESLGWHNNASAQKIFGDEHSLKNVGRFRQNRFEVPAANGGTLDARTKNGQVHVVNVTVDSKQVREGISQFATMSTTTTELGERVVDVSFVPFIRSRRLNFRATGLKPNTEMKIFFDGVDISGYAQVDATFLEFRDDTSRTDFTGTEASAISSDTLVSNNSGTVVGHVVIPNNNDLRFRTGEREVIIADANASAAGEIDLASARTYAKATYTARGLMQTVENQILSTQQVQINNRQETQERTLNTVIDTVATAVRHVDPLAQTFLIDGDLYPGGVFLKDIDLYFRELDPNLPVRIYLAPTQTGIPTQQIIPFSEVKKYPSREKAVAAGVVASNASDAEKDKHVAFASTTASTATTFTFKAPIYLKPGTEYSVVVLSNSAEYTLWHSEVGGTDVTAGAGGQRITKNPYTGVALKSANASTWTPDQTKDFKFTLRKFTFATGANQTLANQGYGTGAITTIIPNNVSLPITISSVNLLATSIRLPRTGINFTLNLDGTNYRLTPGRVVELDNQVTISNANDLQLTCTFNTSDPNLTPLLDANRLTIQTFSNIINKPTGNDEVSRGSAGEASSSDLHGKATARYITKTTELKNAASQIDMFLDIHRPDPRCDVFAFARFDNGAQFKLLQSSAIPVGGGYSEVNFTTAEGDDVDSFTTFEIKIVMVSDDIAVIPQCKNLRVIATA